ncbi:hypothetical protein LPJ61_000372 [Coemansia biformis]|uniref:Uncharacterized protein n=1 Tax=Coemansia biformis TaxID=1286918 RepID=A0A9W8D1P5_9FUNG|nr:hypothetical protein LPJ61_000372 [Coemansia biformis]
MVKAPGAIEYDARDSGGGGRSAAYSDGRRMGATGPGPMPAKLPEPLKLALIAAGPGFPRRPAVLAWLLPSRGDESWLSRLAVWWMGMAPSDRPSGLTVRWLLATETEPWRERTPNVDMDTGLTGIGDAEMASAVGAVAKRYSVLGAVNMLGSVVERPRRMASSSSE